ncbi:MAG: SPOR domain-containing protein [Desulfobacterales bacterium]|nr:SPOR domain-containing protein [Desulfobacterales bacterium]
MAHAAKTEKKSPGENRKRVPAQKKSRQWIILLAVSAWMFALGVLVGRGTSPVHFDIEAIESELASLRQAVMEKENLRFRISEDSEKNPEQLEFYENLKKSAPERTPAPAKKNTVKPGPVAQKTGEKKKSPAPARMDKPAPQEKPAEKPQTGPPAEPGEKPYTVQVASLREVKTADAMVDQLRAHGYPAYRERAEIEGKGTWHRVRIGSFADSADASPTLEKLQAGGLKPMLIRR